MLKVDLVTGNFPLYNSGIGRIHATNIPLLKGKTDIKIIYTNLLKIRGLKYFIRVSWLIIKFISEKRYHSIIHIGSQENAHLLNFINPKRTIVTVCDIYPYLYKNDNLFSKLLWHLRIRGLKRARKIISISNKTKEDLIKYFGIEASKIKVIYLGVDEKFKPIIDKQKLNNFALKNNLHMSNKYILYVGSSEKRKNVDKIILAFMTLRKSSEYKNLKLLLITNLSAEIKKFITRNKLDKDIDIRSNIKDEELVYFYNIASVFVYPSLYEGFGFPPLEAMACGCPVITSNSASLPEIVGSAGIKIPLINRQTLSQAIREILSNKIRRIELIKKGTKHAENFSWDRCSQETLEVYKQVSVENSAD